MARIMAELHMTSKAALPRRAIMVSLALLAVAVGLAGSMTLRRAGGSLGLRVAPSGWGVSFQPPADFERVVGSIGEQAFRGAARGGPCLISFRRVDLADVADADAVALAILRMATGKDAVGGSQAPVGRVVQTLGRREAVELFSSQPAFAIRAARLTDGSILAVSIIARQRELDHGLYQLFDLVCRSVEYE